jgi:XrtJ-associated TM-motif-TM protein
MKQKLLLGAIVMLAVPMCGRAQNGCLDSPENPTAVLLLVGGAGAALKFFRTRRR